MSEHLASHERLAWARQPWFVGLAAPAALLALYFLIVSWANGAAHALEQFEQLAAPMLILLIGFGLQCALFAYMRGLASPGTAHGRAVAANAGVSTAAMVACCVHHVADVAPLLGLTALAALVGPYQREILAFGVVANFFGIGYLLFQMRRHGLSAPRGGLARVLGSLGASWWLALSAVFGLAVAAYVVLVGR